MGDQSTLEWLADVFRLPKVGVYIGAPAVAPRGAIAGI